MPRTFGGIPKKKKRRKDVVNKEVTQDSSASETPSLMLYENTEVSNHSNQSNSNQTHTLNEHTERKKSSEPLYEQTEMEPTEIKNTEIKKSSVPLYEQTEIKKVEEEEEEEDDIFQLQDDDDKVEEEDITLMSQRKHTPPPSPKTKALLTKLDASSNSPSFENTSSFFESKSFMTQPTQVDEVTQPTQIEKDADTSMNVIQNEDEMEKDEVDTSTNAIQNEDEMEKDTSTNAIQNEDKKAETQTQIDEDDEDEEEEKQETVQEFLYPPPAPLPVSPPPSPPRDEEVVSQCSPGVVDPVIVEESSHTTTNTTSTASKEDSPMSSSRLVGSVVSQLTIDDKYSPKRPSSPSTSSAVIVNSSADDSDLLAHSASSVSAVRREIFAKSTGKVILETPPVESFSESPSSMEVSKFVQTFVSKKIILDPVMVAKGGTKLINRSAINILKKKLIKKAFLVTPNIPEIEILSKIKIKNINDMVKAGRILMRLGVKNVLVKGGHTKSKFVEDVLLSKGQINIFRNKRIITKNTHGTGCTLSSAITTFLSCGKPLKKSCELGIKYVNQAIKSNLVYGKGNGPINHLNSFKLNRKFL